MHHPPEHATRVSDLRDLGLSKRRLQSKAWARPHWGITRAAVDDPHVPHVRIADIVPILLPGCHIGGWAAAFLQGVRYLDGGQQPPHLWDVLVHTTTEHRLRPRAGMRTTRRAVHANEITEIGRAPVTTIARAAYDMALDARNLHAAVLAYDMCLSTTTGHAHTTPANLEKVLSSHHKTRGIQRARRAFELSSTRSASPSETRTRMIAVLEARIEDWMVNAPVFDTSGDLLGIVDLLNPETGLVLETDGAHHLVESTYAADNHRQAGLERVGLTVLRISRSDHRDNARTAGRIRAAYEHLRREPRRSRWTIEKPQWWTAWEHAQRWG